eukprot:3893528-Rhodomonas_salina.1
MNKATADWTGQVVCSQNAVMLNYDKQGPGLQDTRSVQIIRGKSSMEGREPEGGGGLADSSGGGAEAASTGGQVQAGLQGCGHNKEQLLGLPP